MNHVYGMIAQCYSLIKAKIVQLIVKYLDHFIRIADLLLSLIFKDSAIGNDEIINI